MGKLRDKAEAGLKNKRERDAEVRRKRTEGRKQAHAEFRDIFEPHGLLAPMPQGL